MKKYYRWITRNGTLLYIYSIDGLNIKAIYSDMFAEWPQPWDYLEEEITKEEAFMEMI